MAGQDAVPPGAFADWLAEPVRIDLQPCRFYAGFSRWLLSVERRAQDRQRVLRRLSENALLSADHVAGLVRLYDRLAALGLGVQMALERFWRRLSKGRQHDVFEDEAVRGGLGQNAFEGVVEGHVGFSVCGLAGDRSCKCEGGQ